jgi:hypothetical protein
MTPANLHRKLQQLVGQQFDYLGETWILIEILADIDSVVLRRCRDCGREAVQQNLYGMPNRRAGDTLTLAISDSDGEGYSQDLLLLLEGRKSA